MSPSLQLAYHHPLEGSPFHHHNSTSKTILSMLSLSVVMVPSSANKSHFTDLCEKTQRYIINKDAKQKGGGEAKIDP